MRDTLAVQMLFFISDVFAFPEKHFFFIHTLVIIEKSIKNSKDKQNPTEGKNHVKCLVVKRHNATITSLSPTHRTLSIGSAKAISLTVREKKQSIST
jgi:tRNA uridine 5-carbamoylmethylation protein Kti12